MRFPYRTPRGDDQGSLVLASLFIVISVGLTTLMASLVVGNIGTTRGEVQRVRALHAAQAGLDSALAQMRAADDGAGNGVRTALPCGPFSGGVGAGSTEQYSVALYYVADDPRARMTSDPSWFAAPANHLSCAAGSGPAVVPQWAVLYSTGTDASTSRVLRGAYRIRTTNQNILGGKIHLFYSNTSTRDLCMDAVDLNTVTAGTAVQMADCDTTGTRREQIFAYLPDSTIQLVDSVTVARPTGLCLDAGPTPHVEGAPVTFELCLSPVAARQQWLVWNAARLEGMASATSSDGFAMQLGASNVPGPLTITHTPFNGHYNNRNSFGPEASVGPGGAGPANGQLVNFSQYGRCVDLNGGNYANYMIAWPCKPDWNQTYVLPTPSTSMTSAVATKIVMNVGVGVSWSTPAGMYCLQSPRSTALGAHVYFVPCTNASAADNLQWRLYGNTGDYTTSFRIVDVDGHCLQVGDQTGPMADYDDYGSIQISRIVVKDCSGATTQKWNADPNILDGLPLKYVGEK